MTIDVSKQSKRAQAVRTLRELLSKHKNAEALKHAETLPPKLRKDPEILFLWALGLERKTQYKKAIEKAAESLRAHDHPDPMYVLARCYRAIGETRKCLDTCDRIEKKRPNDETLVYLRAGALEEAGRFQEATDLLEPRIRKYEEQGKEPPIGLRLEWSKLLVQNKDFNSAIQLIDETLESDDTTDPIANMQLHLKAKALDRTKEFDKAFEAADAANEIGRIEFSPEIYKEQVDTLIENWSKERMANFPLSQCDSELPVFVAGMPRSGTSLIDQIIDAHPKAAGVGELNTIELFAYKLGNAYDPDKEPPACFGQFDERKWTKVARDYIKELKRLAPPDAERVVNKALGNNKLVGLIARLFPNTRVIHAMRDPRDVAISCFMGGFNNRLHPWTTRIDWAAAAWEQSHRMMQHWKDTLDIPILDVHYEKLVSDPETEFPRIIDFLGLEWDDRCFEFHKSSRTVRTLSYDQVNRPLYKTSAGRHANYARHIDGIDFTPYDPDANGR